MSADESVSQACKDVPEIKRLVNAAQINEGALKELQSNPIKYLTPLIRCIDAHEELLKFLSEENKILSDMNETNKRISDHYYHAFTESFNTLKQVVAQLPELFTADSLAVQFLKQMQSEDVLNVDANEDDSKDRPN